MGTLINITNPHNDNVVRVFLGCDMHLDRLCSFLIRRGLDLSVEEADTAPERSAEEEFEVRLILGTFYQEEIYGL